MPKFSGELNGRLRYYLKTQYGLKITSEESEVFLSNLSEYFITSSAGESGAGESPPNSSSYTCSTGDLIR